MINFKKLFEKSNVIPYAINYKGHHLFIADKFSISNKDTLVISIESTNSNFVQGVSIGIHGYCKILGKTERKGKYVNMIFWEDSEVLDPKNIEIQVFTKKPYVFIRNIWEAESSPPYVFKEGEKHTCYAGTAEWHGTNRWNNAAMYSEELENGKRYFCNDGHPDEDFDDIVFTVKRIKS